MPRAPERDKEQDENLPAAAVSSASLQRLARLLRQQGHAQGLNPAQWEVLRFLARANALSNTPGAVARYLGATKGTVSQTILALEKKNLLRKSQHGADARSVRLSLTDQAHALLAKDGLATLESDIEALGPKTRRRFDRAISALLQAELARQGEPSFGTCLSCRYYREAAAGAAGQCMKVNASVADTETMFLCVEHVPR